MMSKKPGYRIPPDIKPCKFGQHNWEYLGETWMGQSDSFECTYDGDKEIPDDFVCSEKSDCIAYEPCETIICPKHDVEYYADGDFCELCHPEMEGSCYDDLYDNPDIK